MNILIAYTSKTGTTKDCASTLGGYFPSHRVTYADLAAGFPDVGAADVVLVGSPIRMGRIAAPVRKFLAENHDVLLTKHFGLFLCCGFSDNAEEYFKTNFAADLWEKADSAMIFGGETRMDRQKGLDKLVMKLVLHSVASNNRNEDRERDIPLPALIPENIRRFADEIKAKL